MSSAAAKLQSAPPRGATRERQPVRTHAGGVASPVAGAASLRIGRADDAYEAAADRAARQALIGDAHRPVPPAATPAPAPRLDAASGGLGAQIAAARGEGRELSAADRAFFAPRFGHRFDDVRVHAGPAASVAASAAHAQAFTLGRDIYFGDGRYRPDSGAGRELLAHELAHTLQDRPNVVARRALDNAFDAPESDPDASAGPGRADTEPAVDDLATLVQAGPMRGNRPAREQLDALDPAMRSDALASIRTRLPAADRGKVAALAKGDQAASPRSAAPPNPRPQVRAAEPAPAHVSAAAAPDAQQPAPTHQRVAGAAAVKMQEAVRAVGAEAPVEGAPAPPGSLDTGAVPAGGQGPGAPASEAAAAAQGVAVALGERIGELQGVASVPVQFQQDPQAPAGDPEAFARTLRSQSLATQFASRAAEQIQAVLAAAAAVPGQSMAALGVARQAILAQAATQGAALKQGAATARKQIREQAARVRSAIAARRATADTDVAHNVQDASSRATRAHDAAAGGLDRRAETEQRRIARSYDDALEPMTSVGIEVGGLAEDAASARAQGLLDQRNGESSVLDGPIHDDRLEANADASRKVGEEYAKSFRESASQQADRLPDSRPEILAKVDEITGQARTGFAQQLAQIVQGATALETGAKARSRQAATQMRAALDSNATQSEQALDAAEAQQAAALEGQANAAQTALDQSVAAALTSFGEGVGRAAQQLTRSLRSFADSVTAMLPPDTDELAAALATADPSAALTAMGVQVATVVPTLSGMLAEGQQASGAALAAAATDATQGFMGSAAAFVRSANSLSQQSATGFRQLGAGNTRSAGNLATDAEAGFTEAVTNADAAYSQFGDHVEDNFRTGRLQMHDGLWSRERQEDLAHNMKRYGEDAADHVKPRWKRVLKWVVTIVVIVAVIAVTVLSAGALGPVGVVLLGAALGAAAGAVTTIANNLIDGEPWSKGVVKAMIVGAVGGAVGGAGGVLLKGVGSAALRIALEGGVNVVGGVAGEALGSVATGQAVNWTGALMGALVGAGIGAGLGIAGAIRGRIRVGGIGEPAAPPPPRPTIEAPPPAPAGRIRSALEATKILAPRPAPVIPEVNIGGGGAVAGPAPAKPSVEAPPAPEAEAAAPRPRPRIGFRQPGEEAVAAAPEAEAAAPRPRPGIGFRQPGEEAVAAAPEAEAAAPRPRPRIGFRQPGEEAVAAAPEAEAAAPRPRPRIGFRQPGEEAVAAAPEAEAAAPRPRPRIGFRQPGEEAVAAAPEAEAAAPRPRPRIGFRQPGEEAVAAAPEAAPPSAMDEAAHGSGDVLPLNRPRAMVIEPAAPRPGAIRGAVEPIRASGSAPDITASSGRGPRPGGQGEPIRSGGVPGEPVTPGRPRPMIAEPAMAEPTRAVPEQGGPAPARLSGTSRPARPTSEPATVPQAEPATPASVERPGQTPAGDRAQAPAEAETSPGESPTSRANEDSARLKSEVEDLQARRNSASRDVDDLEADSRRASSDEARAWRDGEQASARRDARAAAAAQKRVLDARARRAAAESELPAARQRERDLGRALSDKSREAHLADLRANPQRRTELPCFAAGTPVWTPKGPRNIEELFAGDTVLTFDIPAGRAVYRPLLDVFVNRTTHFFAIGVDGGVIKATGQHRFWLPDERCWLPAHSLLPGMRLQRRDGGRSEVHSLELFEGVAAETYNLSVEGMPMYFVGCGVLAHNAGSADYQFGGYMLYEGTNPRFPGKIYIGITEDLNDRATRHQDEAATALDRRDLTPREREFFEFKRDMKLRPRATGLTEQQARFLEQKNINIELETQRGNVMNRKLVEITPKRMKLIENAIANDPDVIKSGFCQR